MSVVYSEEPVRIGGGPKQTAIDTQSRYSFDIAEPRPRRVVHQQQPAPKQKRCSRKCCFISTALGVTFGLLLLGTIIYLVMVYESQCYRGCHRVCDSESQHECRGDCWSVCWRAQWSKCPEHGARVCAYVLWDKAVVNIFGK